MCCYNLDSCLRSASLPRGLPIPLDGKDNQVLHSPVTKQHLLDIPVVVHE